MQSASASVFVFQMGTLWKKQVALQRHSCPQISEDRVLPQLVWRSPSIRKPAAQSHLLSHPLLQHSAILTPTEKTHLWNKALASCSSCKTFVTVFLMECNNRCLNSTGIERKRLARGINMIAFNHNLTTLTHSAAELCHCFRGNGRMEKRSSDRRGWKPRLYTVWEPQNGWGWKVLLYVRQSNQPFSVSRDTYSKLPRTTSRNNHWITE